MIFKELSAFRPFGLISRNTHSEKQPIYSTGRGKFYLGLSTYRFYSVTVNRAKLNFAPATSSALYSCRPSSRGSPATPMTTSRSPLTRETLGAFAGISTEIPNRDCMTLMLAWWLGLRQEVTPSAITAFASSGESSSLRMEQFPGNIDGAIPKPK